MNRWVLLALCGVFIICEATEPWQIFAAVAESLLACWWWRDKIERNAIIDECFEAWRNNPNNDAQGIDDIKRCFEKLKQ